MQTITQALSTLVELIRREEKARAHKEVLAALGANGRAARSTVSRQPWRRKGQKRDPKDIAALTARLLALISKTPGRRIEPIAKDLGVPTKDLVLPVKRLLGNKKVRTRGTRRATKYFPQ